MQRAGVVGIARVFGVEAARGRDETCAGALDSVKPARQADTILAKPGESSSISQTTPHTASCSTHRSRLWPDFFPMNTEHFLT
jgi:hypothetical protein